MDSFGARRSEGEGSLAGGANRDPATPEIVLFICYRRSDGHWHADWIDRALNGWQDEAGMRVKTYFDRTAPAVGDWTKYHFPSLQSADGLIVICTPGAAKDVTAPGSPDWMYEELKWWVAQRGYPPIVVDATGEGKRWIPEPVLRRWPNINRVPLSKSEAEDGAAAQREQYLTRWRQQIAHTLHETAHPKTFDDLAREKRLTRKLWQAAAALMVALVVAVAAASMAYRSSNRAQTALDTSQALNRFLGGLFRQADPDRTLGADLTAGKILEAGEREVMLSAESQAVRSQMLVAIGAAYTGVGEHERAIALLQRAQKMSQGQRLSTLAEFNLQLALGEALLYRRQFGAARPPLERAFELSSSLDAKSYADKSHALVALGDLEAWAPEGDKPRAKKLYQQALDIDHKASDRLNEARDHNRLGYLANKQNELDDAIKNFGAARDLVRQGGSGDGGLLFAKYDHDYATTGYAKGELLAAKGAFEDARRPFVDVYGEKSLDVAVVDNNLARIAIERDKLEGVEALLRRSVETIESTLDEEDADLAPALNSLGLVQRSRGDLAAAEKSFERALKIAEINDDPRIAVQALVHQSEVRMAHGDFVGAKVLLERVQPHFAEPKAAQGWRYGLYSGALAELQMERCETENARESLRKSDDAIGERWKWPNMFRKANERRHEKLQAIESDASRCRG